MKVAPDELPVSLDRIQRALANTPMLRFDDKDRRRRAPEVTDALDEARAKAGLPRR